MVNDPPIRSTLADLISGTNLEHPKADPLVEEFRQDCLKILQESITREQHQPTTDTSLIEKLEVLKETLYTVGGAPHMAPYADTVNRKVEQAIAIIRQHFAEGGKP